MVNRSYSFVFVFEVDINSKINWKQHETISFCKNFVDIITKAYRVNHLQGKSRNLCLIKEKILLIF